MTRFPQGAAAAIVPQTAARWIAEGITKVGLQVAATGTGVKGSAATADPSQRSTNLVLAPDRHHGGHQRISVNVNGRLPFKVCHWDPRLKLSFWSRLFMALMSAAVANASR